MFCCAANGWTTGLGIPEKLLYHEYLNAFKLFDKYYNNDKIIYISGLTDQIIKYIKN